MRSIACDHRESPVSFLLLGVHGRVSDKHLTVNSGFLKLLLFGDIVLAHKDLDTEEEVSRMQAPLKIPPVTCGCTKLAPKVVEGTRHFANVRITWSV